MFNRFYRLEIHSLMVGIFDLLLDLPPSPQSKRTVYTDSVGLWEGGWGGGVLSCVVDPILQEFNTLFLTRFRTYKIDCTPNKK